jgi:hypothetical protein
MLFGTELKALKELNSENLAEVLVDTRLFSPVASRSGDEMFVVGKSRENPAAQNADIIVSGTVTRCQASFVMCANFPPHPDNQSVHIV